MRNYCGWWVNLKFIEEVSSMPQWVIIWSEKYLRIFRFTFSNLLEFLNNFFSSRTLSNSIYDDVRKNLRDFECRAIALKSQRVLNLPNLHKHWKACNRNQKVKVSWLKIYQPVKISSEATKIKINFWRKNKI